MIKTVVRNFLVYQKNNLELCVTGPGRIDDPRANNFTSSLFKKGVTLAKLNVKGGIKARASQSSFMIGNFLLLGFQILQVAAQSLQFPLP